MVPPTFETLHELPGPMVGARWVGAGLIALWVILLGGLAWAFLVSFYFSGSTVVYYLLRRDVDGVDVGEVYWEQEQTDPAVSATPAAPPAKADSTGQGSA